MKKKTKKTELFWLSFADETGLLGECFVEESGFIEAIKKAHQLGINPGGQVAWFDLSADMKPLITKELRNRLIPKLELMKLFPDVYKTKLH